MRVLYMLNSSYVPNMALTSSYCSLLLPAKHDGWNMYWGQLQEVYHPTGGMVTTRTTTPRKKSKKEKSGRRTRSENGGKCNGNDSNPKNSAIEWRPLLEDNGSGLFSHQVHVTPHIGRIGKTALFTKEQLMPGSSIVLPLTTTLSLASWWNAWHL